MGFIKRLIFWKSSRTKRERLRRKQKKQDIKLFVKPLNKVLEITHYIVKYLDNLSNVLEIISVVLKTNRENLELLLEIVKSIDKLDSEIQKHSIEIQELRDILETLLTYTILPSSKCDEILKNLKSDESFVNLVNKYNNLVRERESPSGIANKLGGKFWSFSERREIEGRVYGFPFIKVVFNDKIDLIFPVPIEYLSIDEIEEIKKVFRIKGNISNLCVGYPVICITRDGTQHSGCCMGFLEPCPHDSGSGV